MLSVPPGDAQTRSVLALAVIVASRVAQFRIAQFTIPPVFALAFIVDASSVRSAIQVAKLHRAVIAAELCFAITFLRVRVEFSVVRAGRKTWDGRLVFDGAIMAGPAFLANASSVGTKSVVGACRMGAIGLLAEASFESTCAGAFSAYAMSMSVAVGHLAFVVRQLTFFTFPARIAVAFAVRVVATLIAQNWTNAWWTKLSCS